MKVAVIYHPDRITTARKLKERTEMEGEVVIFEKTENVRSIPGNLDLVLVVGGDGTVIRVAKVVHDDVPIVGFKAGRLGFLTSYSVDEMEDFFEDIKNDRIVEDRRWLLEIRTGKGVYLALNDVVLQKDVEGKMLEIEIMVDDHSPLWFFADGVVVSTPTGSTAYGLSLGGPMIAPDCDVIEITPMAPQFLFTRSILIPSKETLSVKTTGSGNLVVDGKAVEKTNEFAVYRSEKSVRILRPKGFDFFKVIKGKIGYGRRIV
ncbi:MAG: NAD(+) kinase [Thermotoga sp. 4484_232]|nr:NAD(+) kinase [Thermotogaceae bacterium]OQX59240.1 MAG: NAD(+) kinase [Thermotoga sp. 4484_232]RKX38630.1 MAG: NAD(+) kinase [Thermotogota bacterium]RKX48316.1 MAG: NAD(+) kinase [Thermotoga sp.]RKX56403.1 MAG: NAD(+) kinase [Thermotoga sp.]